MLDKTFDYKYFSEKFEDSYANVDPQVEKDPFMILLPPPNVTGSLHIGHALCYTLQDILARYKRCIGVDVLFQPGLDHAGIVTQLLVEKKLAEKGISRTEIGREKFIEEVWKWKEESGGAILNQMKKLAISCDMDRLCFTMDEQRQNAVSEFFVKLYNDGLIYRSKRLVNWDSSLQTAISDLEVVEKEENGNLWHIRYQIEDSGESIVVATTRPETMFGDTGIAVNPNDDRYKHLIGKNAILPICNRLIKIVADDYANPEKGTGAVKITPAHDFNDFEVGIRHGLDVINIINKDATLNNNVPEEYRGLDRFEARRKVVQHLESLGILEKVEKIRHKIPYSDRSGVIIEPFVTEQWFLDAEKLAGPAIEAVESGETRFVPDHWQNLYFEWMRNIRPWCISRQIWWGHQIPVWYGEDGKTFVCKNESEAYKAAREFYGKDDVKLKRDEDVLDTWFSSGMWPFSTLGWCGESSSENNDLAKYYGNAVVVTGFDIIFFWVARMMMSGIYVMGKSPFKDIYIHGLVRDSKGQKMSKSKGNVIDPLNLCEEYGSDAVRFTLAYLASPGRDVKMDSKTVEIGRNFLTKVWNSVRFAQMYGINKNSSIEIKNIKSPICVWIIAETKKSISDFVNAMENYRFDECAKIVYQFVWNKFCDWFLEMAKPILQNDCEEKNDILNVLPWVIEQVTGLLYPICPFISQVIREEISTQKMKFPEVDIVSDICAECQNVSLLTEIITKIRSVRKELNISPGNLIKISVENIDSNKFEFISRSANILKSMSKSELVDNSNDKAISVVICGATIKLFVGDIVDSAAEKIKLQKELDKIISEKSQIECRLSNKNFIEKAAKEIIEENTARLSVIDDKIRSINELLQEISKIM